MRVLVCGSRTLTTPAPIEQALEALAAGCRDRSEPLVVIEGGARGADRIAAGWAEHARQRGDGLRVRHVQVLADWARCSWDCDPSHRRPRPGGSGTYCPTAGLRRNQRMLELRPDLVLAFVDKPLGDSAGTADTVGRARRAGVAVEVVRVPRRLQRHRTKGWRMPHGAMYVGRPTRWGNPYRGPDAAERFAAELRACRTEPYGAPYPIEFRAIAESIGELTGRDLVCWCPLDRACHADVELELANGWGR